MEKNFLSTILSTMEDFTAPVILLHISLLATMEVSDLQAMISKLTAKWSNFYLLKSPYNRKYSAQYYNWKICAPNLQQ